MGLDIYIYVYICYPFDKTLWWMELTFFLIGFLLGDETVTLPETNIFAPKNGWLEYDPFLLGFGLFSGVNSLLVSGRVIFPNLPKRNPQGSPGTTPPLEHPALKNRIKNENLSGYLSSFIFFQVV